MNEFDKIVRDKLNEEDDFPRMDQNWQKLSARMAPPASAPKIVPHPQLVAWKWAVAATGLLLVSSNIWWWFHQKDATNTVVSAPAVQQLPDANAPSNTVYKTDTVYKIVYRDAVPDKAQESEQVKKLGEGGEKNATKSTPSISEPSVFKKQTEQLVVKQNLLTKPSVLDFKTENNAPTANGTIADKKANNDLKTANKPLFQDNKAVKNEIPNVVSTEKKEGSNAIVSSGSTEKKQEKETAILSEKTNLNPLLTPEKEGGKTTTEVANAPKSDIPNPTSTEGVVKENKAETLVEIAATDATSKNNGSPIKQDTENKIAVSEVPKETKVDKEVTISPVKKEENTGKSTANASDESKQDMELTPIVKPFKWKPEFSIGVNAFVALPAERDLSALKGGGVNVGMKLSEHFRVDIAGSMGELNYRLKVHKPHWHIPRDPRDKPTGGPPLDSELREIEGFQKRKQIALSLIYLFNSKGWLTPKAEIGYAIQRIANQTAKFEFRNPQTGTNFPLTEISAPQTFKNLWAVGLGAEKSFGAFTADVTAGFQKDLSDKSVDMLVLRGGLRYNF
jgi:hypothetical protein